MALGVNFLSESTFVSATSLNFGIVQNTIKYEHIETLQEYGSVIEFNSEEELRVKVLEPANETIGVIYSPEHHSFFTILSGDETVNIKAIAKRIPIMLLEEKAVKMVAIIYIKFTLVGFIAIPVVGHLFLSGNSLQEALYILPSYPVFNGLISIMNGNNLNFNKSIVILVMHCIFWYLVYNEFFVRKT